jgi:hypothetical protein
MQVGKNREKLDWTDKEYLAKTRTCIICKLVYEEIDNVGQHRCRQHNKPIVDGFFTCCQESAGHALAADSFYSRPQHPARLGCTDADHRETYEPYMDFAEQFDPYKRSEGAIDVPPRHIRTTGAKNAAVELEMDGDEIISATVYRYDRQRTADLESIMAHHDMAVEGLVDKAFLVTTSLARHPELIPVYLARIERLGVQE